MGEIQGSVGAYHYSNGKAALFSLIVLSSYRPHIEREMRHPKSHSEESQQDGEGVQNRVTWRAREWIKEVCWNWGRQDSGHEGRFLLSEGLSFEVFLVWVLLPLLTYSSFWETDLTTALPPCFVPIPPCCLSGLPSVLSSLTLPWPHGHPVFP